MGASILFVIASFVLLNGVLMLWEPVTWLSYWNRWSRLTSRSRPAWFEFDESSVARGFNRLSTRLAGIVTTWFGLTMMAAAIKGLVTIIRAAPSPFIQRGVGTVTTPSPLRAALLATITVLGLGLAIFPKATLDIFGTNRWVVIHPRHLWLYHTVWRVIGMAFVMAGLRGLGS